MLPNKAVLRTFFPPPREFRGVYLTPQEPKGIKGNTPTNTTRAVSVTDTTVYIPIKSQRGHSPVCMHTGMQEPSILPVGRKQSKEIGCVQERNHNIKTTHALQQTNHPFLPPHLGGPQAVLTLP